MLQGYEADGPYFHQKREGLVLTIPSVDKFIVYTALLCSCVIMDYG